MATIKILHEGYVRKDGTRVSGTVTLVRGENATVVTDPGMVAHREEILDDLEKEGVSPKKVTHVFISHHHPDHTVNIALFPNAKVVDFWAIYEGDTWEDHDDEYEIDKDIKVLQVPGHSQEDAALIVTTEGGIYALTHLWWHDDMTPKEDPLGWSQEKIEENRKRILEIADYIIPGHGKMFKNPQKYG